MTCFEPAFTGPTLSTIDAPTSSPSSAEKMVPEFAGLGCCTRSWPISRASVVPRTSAANAVGHHIVIHLVFDLSNGRARPSAPRIVVHGGPAGGQHDQDQAGEGWETAASYGSLLCM